MKSIIHQYLTEIGLPEAEKHAEALYKRMFPQLTGEILKDREPSYYIYRVCSAFGVSYEQMKSLNRKKERVMARQALCYILKYNTTLTLERIGQLINKDHATVLYSCKAVQDYIDMNDKRFKVGWEKIN